MSPSFQLCDSPAPPIAGIRGVSQWMGALSISLKKQTHTQSYTVLLIIKGVQIEM